MKKTNFQRIVSLILALMMLVGMVSINVFAAETEAEAEATSVPAVKKNIFFGETINLMFALPAADVAGAEVTVTVDDGENTYKVINFKTENIEGVECATYLVASGVGAQNIDKVFNVAIAINNVEIANFTYSVLEYLYERLLTDECTDAQSTMYNALIAYADAADKALNKDATGIAGKYVYVNTVNCTFDGGKTAGVVEKGATLADVASDIAIPEGGKLVYNVFGFDGAKIATVENIAEYVIENDCVITAEAQGPNVKEVIAILASFDFGAKGNAEHKDGSSSVATKQYTDGDYAISFVNGDKFYPDSFDAKGNSAIKFGTTSAVGKVEFTVADDVTSVVIYVAGYKANNATVSINGTDSSITTHSDDGAYTAIEIDTTENKTISFATTTRCMIDKIEYIGTKTVPAHDCVFAGATCVAKATCTECGALDVDGEFGDHVWDDATCTAPKTCSACGEVDGVALPHSDVNTDDDHSCDVCGAQGVTEHVDNDGDTVCDNGCSDEISAGSTEPEVIIEITKDDFNTSSYANNNNTKTENGYSYTSYQVMQQSGVMQWQKGKGYITTNVSGIVKIEMTITKGAYTVTVGGTSVTGTTSNGVTTYDLTGLTGEIKITVTNSSTGNVDYIKFYK